MVVHTLQSGERILLFQVPMDGIELHYDHATSALMWDNGFTYLPTGNWQLIGLSDEITEEQASTVIDEPSLFMYVDYTAKVDFGMKRKFDTSLESFKSLMQSLGCEGRHAVLREVEQ